jgi:hypothetical protein
MRLMLSLLFIFLSFFASCSSGNDDDPTQKLSSSSSRSSSSSSLEITPEPPPGDSLDRDRDDLGLENAIIIKFKNGSAPDIDNPYNEVTIDKNGENLTVRIASNSNKEYNIIASGTTTGGSLKIEGDYKMGLYLNGANITNQSGSAINIQNNKQISLNLVTEKENSLSGKAAGDAKGAFFSKGQLIVSGGGLLTVAGKDDAHAIATDSHFETEQGVRITVSEAARDGIHAEERIKIKGGTLNITSKGDAVQSENSSIYISGAAGGIVAKTSDTKSHGLVSKDSIVISGGATISIEVSGNGSKGMKSNAFVGIEGANTTIRTSGTTYTVSEDEENKTSGIKTDGNMKISGGTLNIESSGADSKGMKADKNLDITGGTIEINSDNHAIKADGNLQISGGGITAKTYGIKSHGLSGEGTITISGNANLDLNVEGDGSKGIKAATGLVDIKGGTIKIKTSGTTYKNDETSEENRSSGIKTDGDMKISGGDLDIENTGKGSRGIKTDETLTISGGKVKIVSHNNAIKSDGKLTISGGEVYLKSQSKDAINASNKSITPGTTTEVNNGGGF